MGNCVAASIPADTAPVFHRSHTERDGHGGDHSSPAMIAIGGARRRDVDARKRAGRRQRHSASASAPMPSTSWCRGEGQRPVVGGVTVGAELVMFADSHRTRSRARAAAPSVLGRHTRGRDHGTHEIGVRRSPRGDGLEREGELCGRGVTIGVDTANVQSSEFAAVRTESGERSPSRPANTSRLSPPRGHVRRRGCETCRVVERRAVAATHRVIGGG